MIRPAQRNRRIGPFWIAYSLTLTETVGAGILALPIAVAAVGPWWGVAAILALGIVNMITIAAIAEAAANHEKVRQGKAYFGELVRDYLGGVGSAIATGTLAVFCLAALYADYIGFSTILADATGLGEVFWATVLFIAVALLASRPTLHATIRCAIAIGVINLGLLAAVVMLILLRLPLGQLDSAGLPAGAFDGDLSFLDFIFGACLFAFFGHVSVGNCAAMVLQRDGSGRSLMRGCVAAQGTAIVLYAGWILAVNGAIAPDILRAERGTAFGPIADAVGPEIHLLGSVFAIFAMAMASVHFAIGLTRLTRERLARAVPLQGRGVRPAILALLPLAGVYGLAVHALATESVSFAAALSFAGAIAGSVFVGILPVLMLAASRQKPGAAEATVRAPGHPMLLGLVYAVFLAALLAYGTIIWDAWPARGAALTTAALMVALTLSLVRRGALGGAQARLAVLSKAGSA